MRFSHQCFFTLDVYIAILQKAIALVDQAKAYEEHSIQMYWNRYRELVNNSLLVVDTHNGNFAICWSKCQAFQNRIQGVFYSMRKVYKKQANQEKAQKDF